MLFDASPDGIFSIVCELPQASAEFERLGNLLLLCWVGISRLAIYLAITGRFQQAINFERENGTKIWELEAATRLFELWREQGNCQQVHSWLAPLYDRFTDGHNALIIQETKTLLDELA